MSNPALVQRYIGQLRGQPEFAARLPGGIHFADAPRGTRYPFLRCIGSGGPDVTAIGAGVIGGTLFYQVMVIDQAEQSSRADGLDGWIRTSLEDASGAAVEVLAGPPGDETTIAGWVYCRREASASLPVWQRGMPFQQVGGTYRFWIDQQ